MKTGWATALWVLFAWATLTVSGIASLPLLPIDETRYAGVALEMWQRGDLLVPYMNGEPYHHKPPLLFWVMHAGWALFGVQQWWLRLAVSLFSLASAGLAWKMARLLWPQRQWPARLAPVILFGCLSWAAWTPAIMFDAILAFWSLVAVMGIILAARGRPWAGWALTVAGLGLGALTKGPVILILVLPVALLAPLWRPAPGPWWRWYASLLLAVAGGAVIALAWAVPAAIHGGPDYAHAIFWGQSADRMVDSFAHRRPLWWYLPLLLAMLFPWSLWPKAWRALWMLRRDHDWGVRFLWCWILSGVLIFSLVSGKQMHYLLPFLPGFALLLARGLDARSGESPWRWPSRALVAIIPLTLAMASAWLRISPLSRLPDWAASLPLWLPLALLGIAAILWLPYRRLATEAAILGSGTIALVAVLIIGIMQPARPWYDLTPAAATIADAQAHGHAIAHIGKSHNRFRYPGQLIRPISDINAASLQDWGCQHPGGLVILYDNDNSAGLQALHTQALRGKWLRIVRISDLGLPPCSPADVRIGAPAAVSGKSPN